MPKKNIIPFTSYPLPDEYKELNPRLSFAVGVQPADIKDYIGNYFTGTAVPPFVAVSPQFVSALWSYNCEKEFGLGPADICVIKYAEDDGEMYAVEYIDTEVESTGTLTATERRILAAYNSVNGCLEITRVMENGMYASVSAIRRDPKGSRYIIYDDIDMRGILLMLYIALNERDGDDTAPILYDGISYPINLTDEEVKEKFYSATFAASNNLYYALLNENLPLNENGEGGKMPMLAQADVQNGTFAGKILCGTPTVLMKSDTAGNTTDKAHTVGAIRALYKTEIEKTQPLGGWSAFEQSLIPQFPDDAEVVEEVEEIVPQYLFSTGDVRPFRTVYWRGTTSYGKSTGVEMIAAILQRPLLRLTARSKMEFEDFISEYKPNTEDGEMDAEFVPVTLPEGKDIAADPIAAYQMLTGEKKPDASITDCLNVYIEAVKAKGRNWLKGQQQKGKDAMFRHVKSPYVIALMKGYIVEVQEISRIIDQGMLVGLNEYDRPGSKILLSDGSYGIRHHEAFVMYTDNKNFASCRQLDPAVMRRMDAVYDSEQLTEAQVKGRIRKNTALDDKDCINALYELWHRTQKYCEEHDITDGCCSVTEAERMAQDIIISMRSHRAPNVEKSYRRCVVNKATSDGNEQEDIVASVGIISLQPLQDVVNEYYSKCCAAGIY